MKQVIDNFSSGAASYVANRPESPEEIFDFLYDNVAAFDTAWDCGTGNGQVAVKLATRFGKVYGTDISNDQLQHAAQRDNITYLQERAEQTSIPDSSIDLVTVGQAIHWFDFDSFYKEVRRVARPGALVAAWTYSTPLLSPTVNKVMNLFYNDITGPYWDKERRYVDEGYRTITFPFAEIPAPEFKIVKMYTMQQLIGYLQTWSGVKHYIAKKGEDPISLIADDLAKAWGSEEKIQIYWPVHIRAGRVE
jgi:ubiquinone/menaquinone biosynthesis C-methylase UbiE